MAYYSTSYAFNNGTTSTAALMIWRALSLHLEFHQLPMTGEELTQATGLSEEYIESVFRQPYYHKYYGFIRFESVEEFRTWALEKGVLYNPALHDPKPEAALLDDETDDFEDEDEETDADEA